MIKKGSNIVIIVFNLLLVSILSSSTVVNADESDLIHDGYLRVYVVEPDSRWDRYDGKAYHNALLGFAINEQVAIPYEGSLDRSVEWRGNAEEGNVEIVAVLFNGGGHPTYAEPPDKSPFEAHYVDAVAITVPGQTGSNEDPEGIFTHTVIAECATSTDCMYCPYVEEMMQDIEDAGQYPFYYVSLVYDESPDANNRCSKDFNVGGFPTVFFDGGLDLVYGSEHTIDRFEQGLVTSGLRVPNNVTLSVSANWTQEGYLTVDVHVENNEALIFRVGKIHHGVKQVSAAVYNDGILDATNVKWKITIEGGIFGFIDVLEQGTIPELSIWVGQLIETDEVIMGLGFVTITVEIRDAVKTVDAFVLGPLVIVEYNTHNDV